MNRQTITRGSNIKAESKPTNRYKRRNSKGVTIKLNACENTIFSKSVAFRKKSLKIEYPDKKFVANKSIKPIISISPRHL
jgi:hypothetical protein